MNKLNRPYTLILPKPFVFALLATFYIIAFVLTPYWLLASSPQAQYITLLFTIAAGAAWGVCASSSLCVRLEWKQVLFFLLILACFVMINLKPLMAAIPWQGDETYHIMIVISLIKTFQFKWGLAFIAAAAVFLFTSWWKPGWLIPVGSFWVISIVSFIVLFNPFVVFDHSFWLRYPFVSYWFVAILPKVASMVSHPYHEFLYRIFPLVFASAIGWYFQKKLLPKESPALILFGIVVATIPLLFFYSSILYLEMPAVFLMLVVCYHIESLVTEDTDQLRQNTGWYALILVGFIKETTIPFLVSFLVLRWLVQLFYKQKWYLIFQKQFSRFEKQSMIKGIWEEVKVTAVILFPVLFYLFCRSTFISTRAFSPNLANLLEPGIYRAIVQSFIDQFGVLILLFFFGWIILIRRREYIVAGFLILTFFAVPLFHAMDNWTYVGYSRFNLFLLPSILLGANIFFSSILKKNRITGYACASIVVVISLLLSPVNWDGTKKPYWDNYNSDVSEHYYPYREAISWLKEQHPDQTILVAGLNYHYFFSFYFNQYNWWPPYEMMPFINNQDASDALHSYLKEAESRDNAVVLFHVLGDKLPALPADADFYQEKVFQNEAHTLIVYSRK